MHQNMKNFRTFHASEEGSIAIVFALMASIMLGIVGGAVDIGLAFHERVRLQAAADGAAIAGARAKALEQGEPTTVALASFNANYPGAIPTIQLNGNKVSVSATIAMQSHLLQLVGLPTLNVAVAAGAEPSFETITTPPVAGGNVCILLLDGFKSDSLDVGSAATSVIAPDCEVHVKSTRTNQAATFHTNGIFDVAKSCLAGNYDTKGGHNGVIGPIEPGCTTVNNPYAGTLPVPSIGNCKPTRNLNSGTEYMTPGTYCGLWHFKGGVSTINMAPGVYVFHNSVWKFNGTMTGSGVTIYFTNTSSYLQTNGQGTINIQAPSSGTYKGILMYENDQVTSLSTLHINGGQNAIVEGLIYLPNRDMKWNGNSGVDADSLTLVANSLEVTGNTSWRVQPFEHFGITAVGSGGTTTQVMTTIKLAAN